MAMKKRNTKKKREPVSRCSISLPRELLGALDEMMEEKGYDNRSLAIADMIRNQLVEHRGAGGNKETAGTVTFVYDHHKPHLQEKLTELQHNYGPMIVATLHVHLDHDNCLEVLVTRGKAAEVKRLADSILGAKGVKHGRLTMVGTSKDLPV